VNAPNEGLRKDRLSDTPDGLRFVRELESRRFVRFGGIAIAIGLAVFVIWAAIAPLDEGVPSSAVVTVSSKRKTIQHSHGGIVEQILVKDGDEVRADQVLMKLNEVQARSQLEVAQSQYLIALAVESRLSAERDGQPALRFPALLVKSAADIRAKEAMALQTRLFSSRRGALQSELGALRESFAGLEEQILGTAALEASKKIQTDLISRELNSIRGLVEEGHVPRTKMYELERSEASLSGSRSEDLATIAKARNGIAEIKLKIVQRQHEYQKEVETQLTEVQKDTTSLRDKIVALEDELARTVVKAPTDGYVVALQVHTLGGVVQAGAALMDIVPKGETLVLEAQIASNLIDKVRPGLPATIRFSALRQSITPLAEGKVVTVAADRQVDQKTNFSYYPAIISIDADSLNRLGDHLLQPGMSAEVIIKTGERTFFNYLLKPLTDRVATSLKEQ